MRPLPHVAHHETSPSRGTPWDPSLTWRPMAPSPSRSTPWDPSPPQAERRPELCAGAGGDSTGHAYQQRVGLRTRLEKRGLESGRMLIYGCVRHFKELELKAAFEAGWPGKQAESFLYSLRDVIHKDPGFWRGIWLDVRGKGGAGALPADVYDRCLKGMGVPTGSKWEVALQGIPPVPTARDPTLPPLSASMGPPSL